MRSERTVRLSSFDLEGRGTSPIRACHACSHVVIHAVRHAVRDGRSACRAGLLREEGEECVVECLGVGDVEAVRAALMTTSSAPSMVSAERWPETSSGTMASASPWITRTGTSILARSPRKSVRRRRRDAVEGAFRGGEVGDLAGVVHLRFAGEQFAVCAEEVRGEVGEERGAVACHAAFELGDGGVVEAAVRVVVAR